MQTPAHFRIQSLQQCGHLLWEYSFFVRQELRNPVIYLTSALIGLLATWMMNSRSIIPFLIPFVVQTGAQAILRFRNRDLDTLLQLPGQREDPAFIMDRDGNILLATGKTEQLFKKKSILKIIDHTGANGFERLISKLDHRCPDPETRSINIYSQRLQNWYEIKFKPGISHCGKLPEKLLVWFSEVTAQREAELRQRDLLH